MIRDNFHRLHRKWEWLKSSNHSAINGVFLRIAIACTCFFSVATIVSGIVLQGHPLYYTLLQPSPESFTGYMLPIWWQTAITILGFIVLFASFDQFIPGTRHEFEEKFAVGDEMDRLQLRYAMGEIGEEEFEERVEEMMDDPLNERESEIVRGGRSTGQSTTESRVKETGDRR